MNKVGKRQYTGIKQTNKTYNFGENFVGNPENVSFVEFVSFDKQTGVYTSKTHGV